MSAKPHRVLFLCSGNSARSQMAEALVNHFLAPRWEARSAGTSPAGYVHPLAVRVMEELGISMAGHYSKHVNDIQDLNSFDIAITLCDEACEACSVWLGGPPRTHIGFPDPAAAQGTEEERLAVFRQVRDDIRRRIFAFLEEWERKTASRT